MSDKAEQFAEAARTFILQNRYGMLATISASQGGYPFGSIVPYDVTEEGDIVIYVSLIAEHYKNLSSDPRASLIAANYFAYDDPQAAGRATALCDFIRVSEPEIGPIRSSYETRFPESINHEIAHNFVFMRGMPQRVRWIGGFGDIGWVNSDRYRGASPDPLSRDAFDIMKHMNEDHEEALRMFLKNAGKADPRLGAVRMTEIDSSGFTVILAGHGERVAERISFSVPVRTPEQARSEFIRMLDEIRKRPT